MSETTGAQRWAVLIGVDRYHESLGNLRYSGQDCRRLADVLTRGDDAVPPDRLLVLCDDAPAERRPTYANIHSWLASWLSQPDDDDAVLVFFAGHGREMGGTGYLVPADATLDTLHVTGIPIKYVQELLGRCKASQKLLVLDACHSGAGRDVAPMPEAVMDQLDRGRGITTLTSCDVDEVSHEWDEKGHGVFTYYLAEALDGACPPDADGRLTADGVYTWVHDRVRQWAAQHRCRQTPRRLAEGTGRLTLRHAPTDTTDIATDLRREVARMRREIEELKKRTSMNPAAVTPGVFVTENSVPHDTNVSTVGPVGKPNRTDRGEFKVVLVPDDAVVHYYLDEELADHAVLTNELPIGKHNLKIVPRSYRYGVTRRSIEVRPNIAQTLIVRLQKTVSIAGLAGFFASLLYGLMLYPIVAKVAPDVPLPHNSQSLPTLFAMMVVGLPVAVFPLWAIARFVRQLSGGRNLRIFAYIYAVSLVTAVAAAALSFELPPNGMFVYWALGNALICGALFSLAPWPKDYYNTRF